MGSLVPSMKLGLRHLLCPLLWLNRSLWEPDGPGGMVGSLLQAV